MTLTISKWDYSRIANSILEKQQAAEEKIRKELSAYIVKLYMQRVPAEVKAVWMKYATWLEKDGRILIRTGAKSHTTFYFADGFEIPRGQSMPALLKLDPVSQRFITKLYRQWKKTKDRNDSLQKEIRATLKRLRTVSEIKKHLPEAVPFLEVKKPAVKKEEPKTDILALRKKIKA